MPDAITPVARPNPLDPIQTLSGLMGIAKTKQDIQTGVYQQQSAQAAASQATQRNQELQAAQSYIQNGVKTGDLLNPDGSFNRTKASDGVDKVAPVYGGDVSSHLLSAANDAVSNRKALLDLGAEGQKKISDLFAGVAQNPKASKEDVLNAIEVARGYSSDPKYQRMIDSQALNFPDTSGMSPEQASTAVRTRARMLAVGAGAPGASASDPSMAMVQGKQGLVPTNINPGSPLGIGAVGAPQQQGLAPTETPGYKADVAQAGTAGAAAGTRGAQAQDIANKSPIIINSLEKARDLIEKDPDILKGKATSPELLSTLAGVFGIKKEEAANTNDLAKQLAFSSAMRASSLGLSGTDAGQALSQAASPSMKGDAKSLPILARQAIALEKYNMVSGNARAAAKNPEDVAKVEQSLRDPKLLDLMEFKSVRAKAERDEFLKSRGMSVGDMKAIQDQAIKNGLPVQ